MRNNVVHDFYCTQCGNKGLPIYRKKGFKRKAGHLKKMFCIYCQKENNFVEIDISTNKYTYNDFLLEFNHHNFNTDGTRIKDFNIFKSEVLYC